MKKTGVFLIMMAMACLPVGVTSADIYEEGYVGGTFADNIGQETTIKELPSTENKVTQYSHPPTLPLISPPHKFPADTDLKPVKQQEEPLPDPDFM